MNEVKDPVKTRRRTRPNISERYQFQASSLPALNREVPRPEPRLKLSGQPVISPDPAGLARSSSRFKLQMSPLVRIRLVIIFSILISFVLVGRLFILQVQQSADLTKSATKWHVRETPIPARRGIIRDSNGLVLASNKSIYKVYGSPQNLTEKQVVKISDSLASVLTTVPKDKIREALTYKDKTTVTNLIANEVSSELAEKIVNLGLAGVWVEPGSRRVYPNNNLMGQLLGFTNFLGEGAYGIEGNFDAVLKGKPGIIVAERDRQGTPIILGQQQISDPEDGADLTLTIDTSIQIMVERELKKGMEEHQAEKAMALVMDPKTGAILAWASFPNYNPNEFFKTDPGLLKDPVVSDTYEPGSTFKILTAAIGIDKGVITPDSWDNLPGCIIKYGQRICNHDSVGYSHQTVVDTLIHSSNVGAMWIAERIGPNSYYDYLKRFGIGSPTGVDVSGEVGGIIRWQENKDWIPLDFLENAFGQSVAVTPLQVISAVSAVANNGKLMKPYVVSKISREGKLIKEKSPEELGQIIRPESAKITTNMLVQAVRKGETRLANVTGYRVAGKTGTATLYDSPLTIGSTVAYAPADNPKFVVLVRYDKTKDTPWGSNTAAPVVKTIIENLFQYYNIAPTEVTTPAKP